MILCCIWKNIAVSIRVLQTSSIVVARNLRTLIMPFISILVLLFWTSFWIANFTYLVSSGKIIEPKLGSQLKYVQLTDTQYGYAYFQVFMFFWVFEIIQAIFNFVIIVGVCNWYFSSTSEIRGDFSIS